MDTNSSHGMKVTPANTLARYASDEELERRIQERKESDIWAGYDHPLERRARDARRELHNRRGA